MYIVYFQCIHKYNVNQSELFQFKAIVGIPRPGPYYI